MLKRDRTQRRENEQVGPLALLVATSVTWLCFLGGDVEAVPRAWAVQAQRLTLNCLDLAQWSPDGRWLACVCAGNTYPPEVPRSLWLGRADGCSQRLLRRWIPRQRVVACVWSPDSRALAVVEGKMQEDYTVLPEGLRVVSVPDGQTLFYRSGAFTALAWPRAGPLVGAAGQSVLRLWPSASQVKTVATFEAEPTGAAFAPDGRHLAGVVGNHLVIVDLDTGRTVPAAAPKRGFIQTLAWSPSGRRLAYAVNDEEHWRTEGAFAFDLPTGATMKMAPARRWFVAAVSLWSPDGTRLALSYHAQGLNGCALPILYITAWQGPPQLLGFGWPEAWSSDGTRLLVSDADGDACHVTQPALYAFAGQDVRQQTFVQYGYVTAATPDLRQVLLQGMEDTWHLTLTPTRRAMPRARSDWAREEMAWLGRRAASNYADELVAKGRYQEAVDLLEPSHPKGQDAITLASAYLGLGQDERARALLESLVKVRRLWRPEGDMDTQETRREARRVLGEFLVRREPQNPRGYLLLAVHFLQCRDRTQARTWAEKGLAVAPNHADLHFALGKAILGALNEATEERVMQAISEFERALKAEPIHPEALNSLAFACHWQAMRHKPNDLNPAESEVYVRSCERALAAWQTYLKHYSPTATIHFYLGELYQMQGNLEQTARHWEAALELNHWLPALRYNARLARLYEENKQFDRAEAVYRRCLAWDRGNPEKARRHALNAESDLIYFYTRARQWKKAEPLLRARAERTPSVAHFEALAQCYEELGRTEETARWRERAERRRAGKGKG